MIIEVPRRGAVAINEDSGAAYTAVGCLRALVDPGEDVSAEVNSFRMTVEVLQRRGGLVSRALLGAEFVPGFEGKSAFEVDFAEKFEEASTSGEFCPSRLWKKPFILGLPQEFPQAVLNVLVGGPEKFPAGVLKVDRAGFDEIGSSIPVFKYAAAILRGVFEARFREVDIEVEIQNLMSILNDEAVRHL